VSCCCLWLPYGHIVSFCRAIRKATRADALHAHPACSVYTSARSTDIMMDTRPGLQEIDTSSILPAKRYLVLVVASSVMPWNTKPSKTMPLSAWRLRIRSYMRAAVRQERGAHRPVNLTMCYGVCEYVWHVACIRCRHRHADSRCIFSITVSLLKVLVGICS
jgi:hypothetical protein